LALQRKRCASIVLICKDTKNTKGLKDAFTGLLALCLILAIDFGNITEIPLKKIGDTDSKAHQIRFLKT
jgi:hypothetical protein